MVDDDSWGLSMASDGSMTIRNGWSWLLMISDSEWWLAMVNDGYFTCFIRLILENMVVELVRMVKHGFPIDYDFKKKKHITWLYHALQNHHLTLRMVISRLRTMIECYIIVHTTLFSIHHGQCVLMATDVQLWLPNVQYLSRWHSILWLARYLTRCLSRWESYFVQDIAPNVRAFPSERLVNNG